MLFWAQGYRVDERSPATGSIWGLQLASREHSHCTVCMSVIAVDAGALWKAPQHWSGGWGWGGGPQHCPGRDRGGLVQFRLFWGYVCLVPCVQVVSID